MYFDNIITLCWFFHLDIWIVWCIELILILWMTWNYSTMAASENSFMVWIYFHVEHYAIIVLPASLHKSGCNEYDPILTTEYTCILSFTIVLWCLVSTFYLILPSLYFTYYFHCIGSLCCVTFPPPIFFTVNSIIIEDNILLK